jgi:NAD(P)-dependent dehydrogenase (short-subunit alcohol dehydrogenase family)
MGRLSDKVAIITGGAGGIGRAAGRLFCAEGANVLLVDVSEAALKDAAKEIGSNRVSYCAGSATRRSICTNARRPTRCSNRVSYCVGDVTQPADNDRFVRVAQERYGGVDTFLANAGIEGIVKPITEYDVDVFDKVIAVNVRGVWLGLKSVIPALKARGGGSIVITSSVAGVGGTPGVSAYVTSKHAVIGMMRSAALECAPFNIRVNTVNPSPVETRMMRSLEEGFSPGNAAATKEMMRGQIPLQRYGMPDDIAKLMLFLASDDSAFITGSVYMADGGSTAR